MTFGDLDRVAEYIRFVEEPFEGKTRRWRVVSNSTSEILGRVAWWSNWRQYVFAPHIDTVFNKGCLTEINAFIDSAMNDWREARKNALSASSVEVIADA